ncbi:hypothetical protein A2V80_02720 [Candidatus Woesebacteria bacterium RBG_16_39_8b]|uniref:UPF0102 protein A2V80_02720 n=1 Tax=Candidatus Woesebacteria bacterium RBG_16_39_8b TaxID=1802482 RepID=A0A1F7X9R0_9BACT|nr:MAG: hypothetical protein A2V80_02720 [Candidatus Woesebacteria bacterium RBG_16_39_8b]
MKPKLAPHLKLGKTGEQIATTYLNKKGYHIIDRNFRSHYGELDIIATYDETLIFAEVKTRIGSAHGLPAEAVTPWKLKGVIRTAQYYVMLHPELPEALQIDVIAIDMDEKNNPVDIRHYENVTL